MIMKKPYDIPAIEEICLNTEVLLSASKEVSSTNSINGWTEGESTEDEIIL